MVISFEWIEKKASFPTSVLIFDILRCSTFKDFYLTPRWICMYFHKLEMLIEIVFSDRLKGNISQRILQPQICMMNKLFPKWNIYDIDNFSTWFFLDFIVSVQFLYQNLKELNLFQVLRLRGTIARDTKWDVVVDLFFFREPEEAEKEEQAAKEATAAVVKPAEIAPALDAAEIEWEPTETTNWSSEVQPSVPIPGAAPAFPTTDDWATEVAQQAQWSTPETTVPAPAAPNWGGNPDWN